MHIIRRLSPALIVLMAGAVLAGCGSGQGKVNTAAIVGDTRIPLDSVQSDVRWLAKNVPEVRQEMDNDKGALARIARHTVQTRVHHELVEITAEREGLEADPKEVDSLIAQIGGEEKAPSILRVVPSKVRQFAEDFVLMAELAEKYIDRIEVDIVGGIVTGEAPGSTAKDKAQDLARRIADDPDNAKKLATEVSSEVLEESYALSEIVATELAPLAGTPLFTAEPGTVVVTQPSPQQGAAWLVALIKDRKVGKGEGSGDEAGHQHDQQNPQVMYNVGMQLLSPTAKDVGVTLNPRFGEWDETSMLVVPGPEDVTGQLLTSRDQ